MEYTFNNDSKEPSLGNAMVIGGCGFIGSALVHSLLHSPTNSYDNISVVSRNPRQNHHPGATYDAGDITNASRLSSLLQKLQPRTIFHCAGSRPDASAKEHKATNILGTETLLRCAKEAGCVEVVIFVGSHAAVQLPKAGQKITEEKSRLATSGTAFQKSKAKAESLVLAANTAIFRTTVLHFPPVYGENDPHVLPSFLELMRLNKTSVQIGPNTAKFEWLYIGNAIDSLLLASESLLARREGVPGEAFFITDGQAIPWYTFARKIWLNAGERLEPYEINKVPRGLVLTTAGINSAIVSVATLGFVKTDTSFEDVRRLGDGFEWDIRKAESLLGFRPSVGVDEGVKRSVRAALGTKEWKGLQLRGRPPA